jgi:hypothetical protein
MNQPASKTLSIITCFSKQLNLSSPSGENLAIWQLDSVCIVWYNVDLAELFFFPNKRVLMLRQKSYIFFLGAIIPTLIQAAVIHVPDEHPDLRTAYHAAEALDTIVVRPGYYAGDNWTELFFSDKPVRIIGEGGPGGTVIDGRGIDRGLHFRDLADYQMIFEGFTITNCVGRYIGAVNFHENASVIFRNCIIENSRATEQNLPIPGEGGGMRVWGADPIIEDVIIRNCHAQQAGGVNILVGAAPVFRRVRIENCSGGAVMAAEYTNPYFEDCQFINNTDSIYSFVAGVGIYIGSHGHFVRCLFEGNHSLIAHGGGIHIGDSTTVFEHCMIVDNSAVGHAGGIMAHHGARPVFNYCTIAGNSSGGNGDGIGVFLGASPTFNNSIIWQPGSEIYTETSGTYTFNNCNISTVMPGNDNFTEDPRFIDNGDYRLLPDSPCRDRGQHSGERIDFEQDWIEYPDEIWDIGADEIFVPDSGDIFVSISMPSNMFYPGDTCRITVNVNNTGSGIFQTILLVVLDVYGTMYFWPGWTPVPDREFVSVPSRDSAIDVLQDFVWPQNAGWATGIYFHAGIMNANMTDILSNIDSWRFGWAQ